MSQPSAIYNYGDVFEKNEAEWTRKVEIKRKEIPGSRQGMHGYIPTYSRLQRENFWVINKKVES